MVTKGIPHHPYFPCSDCYTMNVLGLLLSFFLFLYFSLEAGEGRAGSKSNTWLVINCKLPLNSIHLAKPRSLAGIAGDLRAVRDFGQVTSLEPQFLISEMGIVIVI